MSTELINLDSFKGLFRNEDAFQEFARVLGSGLRQDFRPIICNQQVIGAALSAEGTKEFLYDRMIKRIAERPELLSELADRAEHDDIVE
jgi:hypothetical protein